MQHNDSKELSEEAKNEYIKQGDALLHEIEFYLERVRNAAKDFEVLMDLNKAIRASIDRRDKPFFVKKLQEKYEQYLFTLKMAEEAHGILAEEKREIIFSLHPKLSEARKLLSDVMSDMLSLDSPPNSKDEEELIRATASVVGAEKIPSEVLFHLGLSHLANTNMQLTSKKFKEFADQLLTDPLTVIEVGTGVHAVHVVDFLEFYMQSEAYKNLREKFETNPKSLSPAEYVCIALTTDNIYELSSIALQSAIEKLPLEVRLRNLAKNLALMSDLIQLHEQPLLGQDEKFIQAFIRRFNTRLGGNEIYMNLQGAKVLPGLTILGGANVKNASLPIHASLNFISEEVLSNQSLLVRQLDQLQKTFDSNSSNNDKVTRMMILNNYFEYFIERAEHDPHPVLTTSKRRFPARSELLEKIIKSIDIVLNHRFTKEKTTDYEFDLKGSVFRLLNSGPDTRIHKKLKDLKKDLETELKNRKENEKKASKEDKNLERRR